MESEKERVGVKKEGEKKRDSLVRFLFLFFFFFINTKRAGERKTERETGRPDPHSPNSRRQSTRLISNQVFAPPIIF